MSNQESNNWDRPQLPTGQELIERLRAAQIAAQQCPCEEHDRLFAEEMANKTNNYTAYNTTFYGNVENTQNDHASQHNNVRSTDNTAYYNNVGNDQSMRASQHNDIRTTNNFTIINNNTFNTQMNFNYHPNTNVEQRDDRRTTNNALSYFNGNNNNRHSYTDTDQDNNTEVMPSS